MGLLVGDVFRHASAVTPGAVAATLGDDALTFAELDRAANGVAHALAAEGLGPGARLAWQGETSLDALGLFAGAAKLGVVFMPLSPRFGPDETAGVLALARPDLVVHDAAALGRDAGPATQGDLGLDAGLDERATHVVFFTSGSTGRPKGVVLSHRVNRLRGYPPLAAEPGGGTVYVPALPHGRLVARARSVARAPSDPPRRRAGCADAPRHRGTTPRHAPVLHPGGLAPHPRRGHRGPRSVGAARSRHRDLCDATGAHRRHPRRSPPDRHPRVLRLDGGRSRHDPRPRLAVLDALPRTAATGQVQRTLLADRLSPT